MEDKSFEQAKSLLENFNSLAPDIQDKLINAVKSLAFLYNLTDVNNNQSALQTKS